MVCMGLVKGPLFDMLLEIENLYAPRNNPLEFGAYEAIDQFVG